MFYHIIDHNGFGTMHKLILPLCEENSNHIMIVYNDILKKLSMIQDDKDACIIIHSTASKKSDFLHKFLEYFDDRRVYIFMHVSVNYELYKKRGDVIAYLKELSDTKDVVVLTPSDEVTKQYLEYGIKAKTIQLGIDMSKSDSYLENNQDLNPYYNKIITTCSSDNDEYKYIKGIDLYQKFIIDNHLEDLSLIAGTDNNKDSKLMCKRFKEKDFLNILAHSLMYVQFSRFESYNITASYAKLFKVPTFIINTEGTISCMDGDVYDNYKSLEEAALNFFTEGKNNDLIKKLYEKCLIKESIKSFKKSFEQLERGY